jgi:nitroimidazol reductase NimA-like FMN-containing flavoprotein (pyridoxamine 5'-phosphate oxidase superfamily)
MHEPAEDMVRLQQQLDQSFESAGAHLKSIQSPDLRLSAEEVADTLTGICILNLATVSAEGAPFVTPVDGWFLRGTFWFSTSEEALKIRHIRQNPRVSAAYTVGESLSVLVHGVAHEVDTSKGAHDYVRDYCIEVYGPSYTDWGYFGKNPFVWIEPVKMFATRLPSGD